MRNLARLGAILACALAVAAAGCFRLRPSAGGGETSFTAPRVVDAADVALPAGYAIEAVADPPGTARAAELAGGGGGVPRAARSR